MYSGSAGSSNSLSISASKWPRRLATSRRRSTHSADQSSASLVGSVVTVADVADGDHELAPLTTRAITPGSPG